MFLRADTVWVNQSVLLANVTLGQPALSLRVPPFPFLYTVSQAIAELQNLNDSYCLSGITWL